MFRNVRKSGIVFVAAAMTLTLACIGNAPCVENPSANINVAGTYRFFGDDIFLLRGTITLTQQDNLVSVTGVTYDNSGDRDLVGGPTALQGNKLDIVMVPKNGDTDYIANVKFIFS